MKDPIYLLDHPWLGRSARGIVAADRRPVSGRVYSVRLCASGRVLVDILSAGWVLPCELDSCVLLS